VSLKERGGIVSVPRFFVESISEDRVLLGHDDSRHALRSLRLRAGEKVTLGDGHGMVARGRLAGQERGRAVVDVEERWRTERPRPHVSIALAAPKGDRLSWAVQKLAELGVDEAIVMSTERSVRAWAGDRADRGAERLRTLAREAAMQSRQPFVTEVWAGFTLDGALQAEDATVLVLWEGAEQRLSDVLPEGPESVRVLVGPEGSFADAEVRAAESTGAVIASLGPPILRTETAAVVGAALVLARYGRLG
jgi:16S rRNA (uracil1498-N3)-methyltransferase